MQGITSFFFLNLFNLLGKHYINWKSAGEVLRANEIKTKQIYKKEVK